MIKYKRLRRVSALFAALSALLLTGCAPSAASDSTLPTLTVGSDTYPPYVYMDNNGDITGLDRIWRAVRSWRSTRRAASRR